MKKFLLIIFTGITLMSCSTYETFWVRGTKTQCDAGAGKAMCLNIYKGNSLDTAEWQQFYGNIEGFEFREGVLQKIKVKREKLKSSEVPADGSSYKYTLSKVIETGTDNSSLLEGSWLVATINGNPVNRMAKLPNAEIDLEAKRISGTDGCNQYSGPINNVTSVNLELGVLMNTKKMCVDMEVPNAFNKALGETKYFEVKDGQLNLFNASRANVLTFIQGKNQDDKSNDLINNEWTLVRLNGFPISKMVPTPILLISTSKGQVVGNNGCNVFHANIVAVDASHIVVRNAAIDQKACPHMTAAQAFNEALLKVVTYKIEDDKLIMYDGNNNELLAFIVATTRSLTNEL